MVQITLRDVATAEIFFDECQALDSFVVFDINNQLGASAADYFANKYKKKFQFVRCGFDPHNTIRARVDEYAQKYPEKKFDLIYIESGPRDKFWLLNILHARGLADEHTILWIKNYHLPEVATVVQSYVAQKFIKIDHLYEEEDPNGKYYIVVAKYIFDEELPS